MVLTTGYTDALLVCSRQMAFNESHLLRAGFPHSDICGSMLVCQLPAAFRRLPRPSSPVIAKASTTCTLSLDPITVSPLQKLPSRFELKANGSLALRLLAPHTPFVRVRHVSIQSIKPSRSARASNPIGIPPPAEPSTRSNRFTSSSLLKSSSLNLKSEV